MGNPVASSSYIGFNLAEWLFYYNSQMGATLQLRGNGQIYGAILAQVQGGLSVASVMSPSHIVASNGFQHVAMTYDKTTGIMNLYYNGTNVASGNVGTIDNFSLYSSPGPYYFDLFLGPYGGSTSHPVLDEISIYNRALSSNEIAAIYIAANGGKCPTTPPVITQQPVNVTTNAGGTQRSACRQPGRCR